MQFNMLGYKRSFAQRKSAELKIREKKYEILLFV